MEMDAIYQEYGMFVYKYLMSLCHDEATAEELTQETFCRAIRSVNRFDGSCKVSTWLCQIAKHIWYQELEKRKREHTSPLEERMPSDTQSPEEEVCVRQEKMELFRKIHTLNEQEKEIVLLRMTGAFSFREIGELFEKSENWARVTFYRAKQKLMKG
jgi:RNA polymerase sigma-70 factor (ECF subfamily)